MIRNGWIEKLSEHMALMKKRIDKSVCTTNESQSMH